MSPVSETKSVYGVVGNDRFLRGEAIAALLRRLEGDADDLGPTTFEGARAELAEVLDEVRTMSLLGGRRVVIVDEADPFVTRHRESLEAYCLDPSDAGTLILSCSSMPRTTRLYKAIEAKGQVVVCEPPKKDAVSGWITMRARTVHGKSIADAAANALREHVGDSLGVLDAELSKLAAYVGTRGDIQPADINALVGQSREENVFGVVDAMASGDVSGAMRHWEQVLATDRAAPGRAIGGLAYSVRRLLAARREMDRGAPPAVAARSAGIFDQAAVARLARCTTKQIEDQLSDLCEADAAIKTGAATLERAIEQFIVTHTQRGPMPQSRERS